MARPGAPVLPFRSFAKRATGLSGASGATVERDATRSAAELSRGDGLWEGANRKTSWLPMNWLGAPLHCEAWRSGFCVLLGSVARK